MKYYEPADIVKISKKLVVYKLHQVFKKGCHSDQKQERIKRENQNFLSTMDQFITSDRNKNDIFITLLFNFDFILILSKITLVIKPTFLSFWAFQSMCYFRRCQMTFSEISTTNSTATYFWKKIVIFLSMPRLIDRYVCYLLRLRRNEIITVCL